MCLIFRRLFKPLNGLLQNLSRCLKLFIVHLTFTAFAFYVCQFLPHECQAYLLGRM